MFPPATTEEEIEAQMETFKNLSDAICIERDVPAERLYRVLGVCVNL
jgi:hypothetical protein